ncbi:MAG: 30S ribosomal protein S21 [Acidobacteriota bacterium]|nr:MAG: 30S ribosomal protein S21 [Acidobacteriota bacterium]
MPLWLPFLTRAGREFWALVWIPPNIERKGVLICEQEKRLATIDLRDGETLDSAIKRFKRIVQRENILREYRQHTFFVRPAERERIKRSVAQKRSHKRFSRFPRTAQRRIVHRRPDLPSIAYEEPSEAASAQPSLAGPPQAPEGQVKTAEQPSETVSAPLSPPEGSQQPSPPNDSPANDSQVRTAKTA